MHAAHDLISHGFETRQFCLFGQPVVPSAAPAPNMYDHSASGLLALAASPPAFLKFQNDGLLEMRCGRDASELFARLSNSLFEATWMHPEFSSALAGDVADGLVVLLVASRSADEHARGSRLLLRHGTRDLRTHEFSAQPM
jgi:hypothetical protein